MHEMSLCEGVLQIIESQAETQGFNKVTHVWLEIGDLAGVEVEAMKFGFDVVLKNSIAENAILHIINLKADAWCMQCSEQVEIKKRFDPCPKCGSFQLQVTGGDQMRVKELEVV